MQDFLKFRYKIIDVALLSVAADHISPEMQAIYFRFK